MLSQGYHIIACNILGFFYVSVNYVKYIFSSKIKKIEIVIYVMKIWYEPSSKCTIMTFSEKKYQDFILCSSVMAFIHCNSVIIGESTGVRRICETLQPWKPVTSESSIKIILNK